MKNKTIATKLGRYKLWDVQKCVEKHFSKSFGFTINYGATYVWQFMQYDCKIRGTFALGKTEYQFALCLKGVS